jgi:hypothetical protein
MLNESRNYSTNFLDGIPWTDAVSKKYIEFAKKMSWDGCP